MNMTLNVTRACNLACRYCTQSHEDIVMKEETAKQAIDFFCSIQNPSEGQVQISFYGGEPLLSTDLIYTIVPYARQKLQEIGKKVVFEITTNGVLIEDVFVRYARRNRILIAVSHDGVLHDYTRKNTSADGTKAVVDEKLKLLLKYMPATPVMMTLHPDSVSAAVDSIKLFYNMGVRHVNMTPAHGSKVHWTDESLASLKEQYEKIALLYEEWNQGENSFVFGPFDNKIRDYIEKRNGCLKRCRIGMDKMVVDTDGQIYPCIQMTGDAEFCIGDIRSGRDEHAITQLEERREAPADCRICALKTRCTYKCACANKLETGNIDKPSAFQCEYERMLIPIADGAASKLINKDNRAFVKRMFMNDLVAVTTVPGPNASETAIASTVSNSAGESINV
ncbi:MAG TPA: radical SAM protein [Bacillota bacterium]|nr:radical SAM protein [Bacillota bacterium]